VPRRSLPLQPPRSVMPSPNRVTPMGDIEAFALRGAWTGNRGIIHEGREIRPVSRERPVDHVRAGVPRAVAQAMAAAPVDTSVLP
jgi:hypothetical protein